MKKIIFLLSVLFLASGCSLLQRPKSDQMLVEKRLIDLEQKTGEIYHRVSVIQFMVDNHERLMKNHKKTPDSIIREESGGIKKKKLKSNTLREKTVFVLESSRKGYDKAFVLYKKGKFKESYDLFTLFEKKYSRNDLADNALYWAGECLYSEKKYKQAAGVFKSVEKKYPDGSKVSDALLKVGYCFYATGDKKNAKLYFKKVLRFYPFSESSKKAEIMLKRI